MVTATTTAPVGVPATADVRLHVGDDRFHRGIQFDAMYHE